MTNPEKPPEWPPPQDDPPQEPSEPWANGARDPDHPGEHDDTAAKS